MTLEGLDWTELTRDSVQWWHFETSVMFLGDSMKAEVFVVWLCK
jgi:hypothetical protein